MTLILPGGRDDGEDNGEGFVEISGIFAIQDVFFFEMISSDRV